MNEESEPQPPVPAPTPHKRRIRYKGKNPRRFEDKYKEHDPSRYPDTVAKVRAGGKTPAGQHVPIMVREIMEVLAPQPGGRAVDCTLGHGGHASELLKAVQPGGWLLALDQDPIEIVRTEARMRALGFPEESLLVKRTNFAGLRKVLTEVGWTDGADVILADLGVSSMQIDNPARGFSFKEEGPLDMRMNPQKGQPASALVQKLGAEALAAMLSENADEPRAASLAKALAQRTFPTTTVFARAIRSALPPHLDDEEKQDTIRRVFQALRIAVNEEFSVLDTWLRSLPDALRPGGRVAVLTFHSGEDRRVKRAFQEGLRAGMYAEISEEVVRPSSTEVRDNSRAAPAKLRWAVKSDGTA
ncbi:16S rRNA (cytosine(1402)-N(4))-methyltransferase RsmH [Roseimicrobium sp. ORNL1]|uniref:16S rRNA (cytosine(1402)-N(4))-methyltransferase RsmH n=1 Tax=Roseimicrobium sp. ORNL1 TaxID=2711231 RepID=UPI0013E1813B|nr:16S rRNA (cytosine(1402)-N(4))-methyltransferase RsmH [Roseimicrobium sp. ORNL1]QIF02669.1 16S rRNA (cytosine(1402)-N(4))-methyltransferase RsmH [Roseimicrobium sp. ORNL1]